jgi:hypothetical protein
MDKYKSSKCYACRVPIQVLVHDYIERNYCHSCAMAKIGALSMADARGGIDQYE